MRPRLALAQSSAENLTPPVWQLQWEWTWAPWVTLLFVVAVIAIVGYFYAREASPAGKAYRTFLAMLRLTSIALVMLMLTGMLMFSSQQGLPQLHVVVDASESMNLPAAGDGSPSRIDTAQQLLLANDGQLLKDWQQKYELQVVAAADGSSPLDTSDPDALEKSLADFMSQSRQTSRSRIGDAMQSLIVGGNEAPPAAIVLFSDGRNTAGRSLDEVATAARDRSIPLYIVGLGSTEAPVDLGLSDLLADELALSGDLVAMDVNLTSRGLAGESATVRVVDTETGELEYEERVELTDQGAQPLQLLVQPKRAGRIPYRIEVAGREEEQNLTNNQLDHTIEIRDEKLRVLLAAGYPNYEFRYLQSLLSRDTTFQLSTFLQEADVEHATQDETAISQLPLGTEDIEEFDVVLLIDLDPRLLPPRWWRNVRHLVVEKGGGLGLVAGPRHFPAKYGQISDIAGLSPVDLASVRNPRGMIDSGFTVELTPVGRQRAAMQLGSSQQESATIWASLPEQFWYADVEQVKPAAQVLAVHPHARTSEGQPLPLICLQYVGSGRVLYHGIDSTWRWRYRVGDAWFARYWGQSLRHLARSKVTSSGAGAEISIEREQYELGEPVRFQVRLSASPSATGGDTPQLVVEGGEGPPRRIPLVGSRLAPNILQATASDLPPGEYRVRLVEPMLPAPPDAVTVAVKAPPGELADVTMNAEALRSMASSTYGKFYTLENANELAADLPKGTPIVRRELPPVELWNKWWMLAAITGCLTLEWILRKRRAML
jgi:hypothetical protein